MPSPIELNLLSLLPTLSLLPPELVALSTSFLAQSRAKASSLKPEEEIGRTYACCHIACERLKNKLALEVTKPAPPVKPRVYNKLYAYLDSVLKTTTTNVTKTPRKNRPEDKPNDDPVPTSGKKSESRETTKAKDTSTSLTQKRPATTQPSKPETDIKLPKFAMPLIRYLCQSFVTPEALPHLVAGTESALQSERRKASANKRKRTFSTNKPNPQDNLPVPVSSLPALILTIFIPVTVRMYGGDPGEEEEYCGEAVKAAREFLEENKDLLPFEWNEGTDMVEDIKRFREEMLENWMNLEWYGNVPDADAQEAAAAAGKAAREAEARQEQRRNSDEDEEEVSTPAKQSSKTPLRRQEKHAKRRLLSDNDDVGAAGLLPGLGTMFQPAVDWLSDEKQADYKRWRRDVERQLVAIEQVGT